VSSLRGLRFLTLCLSVCLSTLGPLAGTLVRAQATGSDIDTGVGGCPSGVVCLTTYQSGVSRRGQNNSETTLTWNALTSTSSPHFHQLRSVTVNGAVYAQPLILPNVVINSATYANVIYAATEQDWVYAIDAATGNILWSDSLANYQTGRTWLTASDENNCANISPNPGDIGITGTPVIDITQNTSTTTITKGTLYVVSRTKDSTPNYYQTIFAIDVTTGNGGGANGVWVYKDISGTFSVPGGTNVTFGQQKQNQRGALLAVPSLNSSLDKNPEIIITWGSHCDHTNLPYNGWMMAYQLNSSGTAFAQAGTWVTVPQKASTNPGGLWQGGAGPAADSSNNIYFAIGNGDNNMNTSAPPNDAPTSCASSAPCDYGDSVMKMKLTTSGFSVLDFFTPYDQATRQILGNDYDLGSGGLLMVPYQSTGNPKNLLLQSGKEGWIYLLQADTGSLGGYSSPGLGPDSVIENLQNQTYDTCYQSGVECGVWGAPAWFTYSSSGGAGYVYFGGRDLNLRQYLFTKGNTTTLASIGTAYTNQTTHTFHYPGTVPAVSSQSNAANGIVWAIDTASYSGGIAKLYAFKATNLTCLYTTDTAGDANCTRTSTADFPPGIAVKFTVPSVANGLVVMGTADNTQHNSVGHVVIYGVN
jgi:hypothetical protein